MSWQDQPPFGREPEEEIRYKLKSQAYYEWEYEMVDAVYKLLTDIKSLGLTWEEVVEYAARYKDMSES